jgi:hypothetical protein
VDRLNRQSAAIQYNLVGQQLAYQIINAATLTNFDRQMRRFIDAGQNIRLRLITRAGQPLLIDDVERGYVDLDDLLRSDNLSFQMNMIHFITERLQIPGYTRRIGTPMPEFNAAHRRGLRAETEHLRNVIGDPTIQFVSEPTRPGDPLVFVFRSTAERYRIFHRFPRGGGLQPGTVTVRTADGRTITVDQLMVERAAGHGAAAPAPVPALSGH